MFRALFVSTVITLGIAVAATASTVPAAALDVKCESSNAGQCNLVKSKGSLETSVWNIMQTVFAILGGIAVIMVVVGAFMYVTSAGDSGKVKNAKNTILYSVVGLVIAIFAAAIVSFITGYFT